ncbi:flagellar type III secretion system pore protein FliP [Qingshengfaniella alkalisoli]|uniref:Flagellar biosynthetic protein FliP n=1 Tax=Qingshengfaniella alkalisoli TaxID=2599296 RepID=A0A5B8J702_9RHOB|nr:flagellar type III secretion system pore protein FliP [Qingshengfaniella alkalisoli]QDY70110.1 flagellar type III secretion system pore protein FliP [Qingshengfaniella alkalisoli]
MTAFSIARLPALAIVLTIFGSNAAFAQDTALPLLGEGSISARSIQLFILLTVLSLAPALAIMVTCFPFIVTVLSILRSALGLQQSPPNMLIISLSIFLTYFVMDPVFTQAWQQGVTPLLAEQIEPAEAFTRVIDPFRTFMAARLDADAFKNLAALRDPTEAGAQPRDAALSLLVPSFMLSELERAFEIGFLVFLPFLIIDLVVAAILMSMGMMMVPPAIVSLPFKLAFFVVADGWSLLSSALVRSYF